MRGAEALLHASRARSASLRRAPLACANLSRIFRSPRSKIELGNLVFLQELDQFFRSSISCGFIRSLFRLRCMLLRLRVQSSIRALGAGVSTWPTGLRYGHHIFDANAELARPDTLRVQW